MSLLYQQRSAWTERWDPRAKITVVLCLAVSLITNHRLPWMAVLLTALVLLWGSARLPWRLLLVTLLSVGLLFVTTLIYHALLTQAGAPAADLLRIGGIAVSRSGLTSGVAVCLQIAGIVMLLGFLIYSTPPLALAEAAEAMLSPLKRLKVPVHEAVMIFTIAIRFLPILAGEFDKVRKAQIARGAGFHRGSLFKRLRGALPLLLPVFIQAILRAEELATAMEARCYRGDIGRTPLRVFRVTMVDVVLIAVSVAWLFAPIVMR